VDSAHRVFRGSTFDDVDNALRRLNPATNLTTVLIFTVSAATGFFVRSLLAVVEINFPKALGAAFAKVPPSRSFA